MVIVLCAAGEHFSGGHDLGSADELEDRKQRPLEDGLRAICAPRDTSWTTLRWRELPKPTLAAVQGYRIFAGWMVASAMDVIFAADDAMFWRRTSILFDSVDAPRRKGIVVREPLHRCSGSRGLATNARCRALR